MLRNAPLGGNTFRERPNRCQADVASATQAALETLFRHPNRSLQPRLERAGIEAAARSAGLPADNLKFLESLRPRSEKLYTSLVVLRTHICNRSH